MSNWLKIILPTFLLVLLAFNSGVRLFIRTVLVDRQKIRMDVATYQEERLKDLRASLPKRSVIGFAQDDSAQNVEKLREFFLTQYVLSPLILTKEKEQNLIIANFKTDLDFKNWLDKKSFIILKDLENGVALLQRRKK